MLICKSVSAWGHDLSTNAEQAFNRRAGWLSCICVLQSSERKGGLHDFPSPMLDFCTGIRVGKSCKPPFLSVLFILLGECYCCCCYCCFCCCRFCCCRFLLLQLFLLSLFLLLFLLSLFLLLYLLLFLYFLL